MKKILLMVGAISCFAMQAVYSEPLPVTSLYHESMKFGCAKMEAVTFESKDKALSLKPLKLHTLASGGGSLKSLAAGGNWVSEEVTRDAEPGEKITAKVCKDKVPAFKEQLKASGFEMIGYPGSGTSHIKAARY